MWLDLLRIVAIALLVFTNGFFVAAEFALVSVRKTRVAELLARGDRSARWVEKAIQAPERFIAATQLGITLSSLALGWLGEPALAHLFQPLVGLVPASLQPALSHGLSATLAFVVITFFTVVLGELTPKSIALSDPERTALFVSRPTVWTESLLKPVIWVLNGAALLVLRLLKIQPASPHDLAHSVEEIKMLVSASAESGVVEDEEEEMVHAALDFGDMLVRQVMVPRTEMVAVPVDTGLQSLIETVVDHPFTKLPVYDGDLDHIVGIVHLKDIMKAAHGQPAQEKTARDLMRPVTFVPEAARLSTLLRHFRSHHQHMAVVFDEYGGTAGVVTLEDLVEEIVGEVSDVFDEESKIRPLADGTALIDGLTLIDEVNEHFHLDLQDPDHDTIAGYVLGRLGRVAQKGDEVLATGARLRVLAMDGLRISTLSLTPSVRAAEQGAASASR